MITEEKTEILEEYAGVEVVFDDSLRSRTVFQIDQFFTRGRPTDSDEYYPSESLH